MFIDRNKLKTDLFGLVGFHNADNPDYPTLIPSLLESRSGKYVNDAHPLITIENIDQSIKNFSSFNYPVYSTSTRDAGGYTTGSKIVFNQKNYEYIATAPSNAATPDPPDLSTWREIDELSDFLVKSVNTGIDEMTDAWIDHKKVRTIIKSIYDKILLFSGVANFRDIEANQSQLVGLRIRMKRQEKSLATIINKLGHHFTSEFTAAGLGTLTFYLYHSSQQDPLYTFQLEHTKGGSQQWTNWNVDNNILRYIDDNYDAGGDFFLCYKQSELEALGAQAYRYDIDWRGVGCNNCGYDYGFYEQYSEFIDVVGFNVAESDLGPGDTIFNPVDVSISYDRNYGLNLNLSTRCDVGYLFEEDEYLAANALHLSIARVLMRSIAHNTRGGNNVANQVKQEAKKELFSHKEAYGTLEDRWRKAIHALEFDLSGLGESCFPCDDGKEEIIIGDYTLS